MTTMATRAFETEKTKMGKLENQEVSK